MTVTSPEKTPYNVFNKVDLSKVSVFLPYQGRWTGDKSTIKIIEKSRRTGITWAEAGDDVLTAAAKEGENVWYIGYNKDMAQEYINTCAAFTKFYNLIAGEVEEEIIQDEDKDIITFKITYSSGYRITALSSRPSNLRGKQGVVILDEAAFHDDLDELLKAAIALTMWGGKVIIISTHNGEDNPFNNLIKEVRAGKKPYSLHKLTFDDALKEGLYKRICLVTKKQWSPEAEAIWAKQIRDFYGDDAAEELDCVPSKGGGRYFTRALIERCLSDDIPILTYKCEDSFVHLSDEIREAETNDWCEENLLPLLENLENYKSYFGEDFARTGDLSVIVPLQEKENLRLDCPFIVEERNVPFEQQKQILFYIIDRLPIFSGGALDARGNGQYLAEVTMQKYGADLIHQVMLSRPWYQENFPKYKVKFEDDDIRLPKHQNILDDHRTVVLDKGVPLISETTKDEDKNKRHGDSAIAGCLAVFAVNNDDVSSFAESEDILTGSDKKESSSNGISSVTGGEGSLDNFDTFGLGGGR